MDLEAYYEVARVSEFIRNHGFTRVALQFPDELLKDSMRVLKALRGALNSSVKLYLMADTTYGNCCVDEVGAAHVNAQCVVHYGHTCLSPTSTLPALFIFGKDPVSTEDCARCLWNYGLKSGKPVLLLFGLEYAHAIPQIKKVLASSTESLYESTSASETLYADVSGSFMSPSKESIGENQFGCINSSVSRSEETDQNYKIGGLSWKLPLGREMEDYSVFWIGPDNQAFANVVLTYNNCEIVRYDAAAACLASDISPQKRILKRRYYLVEKVKDANMIGILVGTLGAAGYLHMIHQMKDLIEKAGKKSYTFVMGRPNPAKLANFPECDAFIHISCAQTALMDSKEFLAPIITPFEAMIALKRGSQWTGTYSTEFRDLVDSALFTMSKEPQEARFSFFQGGYVEDSNLQDTPEAEGEEDAVLALVDATNKTLRLRDENTQILSISKAKSGAEYLAGRSYHGLDINAASSTLPGSILTGRSGKASGYKGEMTEL